MAKKKVVKKTKNPPTKIRVPKKADRTSIVRVSETHFEVTDPITGGKYVLLTKTPRTDAEILRQILFVISQKGRVEKGRVYNMFSAN